MQNVSQVPAYITATIALIVAIISFLQWRVARDKMRFELYNRRFAVYQAVLNCAESKSRGDAEAMQETLITLVKSRREATFLFARNSGVVELLIEAVKVHQAISEVARAIVNDAARGKKPEHFVLNPSERKLFEERMGAMNIEIVNNVVCLEVALRPYLNFQDHRQNGGIWQRIVEWPRP